MGWFTASFKLRWPKQKSRSLHRTLRFVGLVIDAFRVLGYYAYCEDLVALDLIGGVVKPMPFAIRCDGGILMLALTVIY